MRVGYIVTGLVLFFMGIIIFPPYFFFLTVKIPLIVCGLVLLIFGLFPKPSGTTPDGQTSHLQDLTSRIHWLEKRLMGVENRLWHAEKRIQQPPEERIAGEAPPGEETVPEMPPAVVPTTPASPTFEPFAIQPKLVIEQQPSEPTVSERPAPPAGVSRLELELGERWFQRIGIAVLAVAFVFFLAIAIPHMSPEQIVAVDFAAVAALAILGEYLYTRKGLHFYAKGLEIGAFAIAHIGVWGGGFYFEIPGFPWPLILGALFILSGAAALRYRSPFLSIETGFLFIGWVTWLRVIDTLTAFDFAVLLSLGAVAIFSLVLAQRNELSALTLVFSFDVIALASFGLFGPHGYIPVLSVGLVTAALVTMIRLEKVIPIRVTDKRIAWSVGIALTYCLLIANTKLMDDVMTLVAFATLTAVLAFSEFLAKNREFTLAFATLVGLLSFPIPLLMHGGEVAFLVFPSLLLAFGFVRRVKGLAWLPNLTYLGLIAFVAIGGFENVILQLGVIWGIFIGTFALHVFLQMRSGYELTSEDVPTDLQVLFFVVILSGLTARWISGESAIIMFASILPFAILLNRESFLNGPNRLALAVVGVGASFVVARWWAFSSLVGTGFTTSAFMLALYHLGTMLVLGVLVAYSESKELGERVGKKSLPISFPAMALLIGLFAQGLNVAIVFIPLPLAVVLIAYYLDDAATFNVAYLALTVQSVVGASVYVGSLAGAFFLLPFFASALIVLGLSLSLLSERKFLAETSQLVGVTTWFFISLLTFGTGVETTISWTALGALSVAWGLWRRFADLRYIGFFIFFAVLGKVFLYDIAGLAIEIRILGLVILAIALLAISYGYTQYRKKHAPEAQHTEQSS